MEHYRKEERERGNVVANTISRSLAWSSCWFCSAFMQKKEK